MMSGTLEKPRSLMSFDVIVTTGAGPSICARGMREPVTSTVSSFCVVSDSGVSVVAGCGVAFGSVWAKT